MVEPQMTPLSLDEIFDLLGPDQAEALMFAQLNPEDQKDVVFSQAMHAFKAAGVDEPPPNKLLNYALSRPGLEPADKGESLNGQWYQVIEFILNITEPPQIASISIPAETTGAQPAPTMDKKLAPESRLEELKRLADFYGIQVDMSGTILRDPSAMVILYEGLLGELVAPGETRKPPTRGAGEIEE